MDELYVACTMKDEYVVSEISLDDARPIIQNNNDKEDIFVYRWGGLDGLIHKCYGLYYVGNISLRVNELVGAVQFVAYQKGRMQKAFHDEHFGCYTDTCEGFYELARLAVEPTDEHNITSWFVSRAIKLLNPKVLVTVAEEHKGGTIYKATNFDYYGLHYERDYYEMDKPFHVYLKIYDKNIECKWRKDLTN